MTRVVIKVFHPSTAVPGICVACHSPGWPSGRPGGRKPVVIANVYEVRPSVGGPARWARTELWHPGCYEAAGSPYGEPVPARPETAALDALGRTRKPPRRPTVRTPATPPPPPASTSPEEGGKEHDMAELCFCGREAHHRGVHRGQRAVKGGPVPVASGGGQPPEPAPREPAVAEPRIEPVGVAASNGHHEIAFVTDTSELDAAMANLRAAFDQLAAARIRVRTPDGKEIGSSSIGLAVTVDINGHRVAEHKGAQE